MTAMTRRPRSRAQTLSTRRLEAFTDGVFAIAATLLVLNLGVDKLGLAAHPTAAQLWAALGASWESMLSFSISFLLLCLLWYLHVRQFEHVVRTDVVMIWLNSIRLLGVVLIPFTTSLNSAFNSLLPGKILMPANFLFVLLISAAQWFYATSPQRGLVSGLSPRQVAGSRHSMLFAAGIGVAVTALSPWLGSWAFLLFILGPIADAALRRRGQPALDPAGDAAADAP